MRAARELQSRTPQSKLCFDPPTVRGETAGAMAASRLAWMSVGASQTDLDSDSSSTLLHSIYGSQLSRLSFCDSEASLLGSQSESATTGLQGQRRRPKSSPAASYLARERQKERRPGSSVGVRPAQRPVTARANAGGRRPPSAAWRQRPASARPGVGAAGGGGGRGGRLRRPQTALGMVSAGTRGLDVSYA